MALRCHSWRLCQHKQPKIAAKHLGKHAKLLNEVPSLESPNRGIDAMCKLHVVCSSSSEVGPVAVESMLTS